MVLILQGGQTPHLRNLRDLYNAAGWKVCGHHDPSTCFLGWVCVIGILIPKYVGSRLSFCQLVICSMRQQVGQITIQAFYTLAPSMRLQTMKNVPHQ